MDDPEYDVHPLERDYSEPDPKTPRLPRMPEGPVHRAGVIIFLLGFFAMLVTAALLGIFRGAGWVETFGSYVHRFAMVMILAGGILIIIGLRVRTFSLNALRNLFAGVKRKSAFLALLLTNIGAFVGLWLMIGLARETFPQTIVGIFYGGAFTIAAGLFGVMSVQHRGMVQGYAIGALVAMLMGSLNNLVLYSGFYGGGGGSFPWLIAQQLAFIQITGMVAAAYAGFMEPRQTRRKEASKKWI